MYKIFGIPNCDTVKKARTFLENKGIDFEFIDFKKYKISTQDIIRWSEAFGDLPVNKKGLTYKKHKEEFEGLSDAHKKAFLQEHSSMIKRPILEKQNKVITFGFNQDEYHSLFE
jgi:arsenate reductase (glutaredoxin)